MLFLFCCYCLINIKNNNTDYSFSFKTTCCFLLSYFLLFLSLRINVAFQLVSYCEMLTCLVLTYQTLRAFSKSLSFR